MDKSRRIVVLDDLFEDRFFLCRLLRQVFVDATIEEFVFSEDAFAHLKALPPEEDVMIFVDLNIPRMDGFEFIDLCEDQIYSSRDTRPEFVMVSNFLDREARRRVESDPRVKAYIPKPATRENLISLMEG